MQITVGRSGSWFDDQTAAENITSSNAQSKHARMAGVGSISFSQCSRTRP